MLANFGPPIAAALLSFFFSARHTNRAIEKNKIASKVEHLIQKIEKVAEEAAIYYESPPSEVSRQKEIIIQHSVGTISREVHALSISEQFQKMNTSSKSAMIFFRQKITGGDFRSTQRKPLPESSMLSIQIMQARDSLILELQKLEKNKL